jgi:hypothetical protein
MRDVLVTQILLNCSRIMPVIRQLVAASMAQHVRMYGKRDSSDAPGACDNLAHTGIGHRAFALGGKHVGTGILTPNSPKRSQLRTAQRVH